MLLSRPANVPDRSRSLQLSRKSNSKRIASFITTAAILSFTLTFPLYAATSSIEGYVRGAKSNESLPGATVMLVGTSMGAATRLDGSFSIENVPVGSYTLRVTYVGYQTKEMPVKVAAGKTSVVSIKLLAVAVKGKEVLVTAQASGQNGAINQQLTSNRI